VVREMRTPKKPMSTVTTVTAAIDA